MYPIHRPKFSGWYSWCELEYAQGWVVKLASTQCGLCSPLFDVPLV